MTFKINATEIKAASKRVRGTVSAIKKAEYRTVNAVASKNRTAGSKAIRNEIKLPAEYVNKRLYVSKKATLNNAEAIITGRKRPTRLATYGAKQLLKAAGGAKGDSLRSIGSGKKQAGVSVRVRRSEGRKKYRKAFLLPLESGNGMGMFIRFGSGKKDIRHMYGPSVDMVWRDVKEDLRPKIRRDLSTEFSRQLAYLLGKEV